MSTIMEWRPVVGYPDYVGLYEVSEFGDVRRIGGTPYCRKTRVLKPWKCNRMVSGRYRLAVYLADKGLKQAVCVHILVARAFLGDPPTSPDGEVLQIDHVDGNPLNNHYKNLEYVTLQENHDRTAAQGRRPIGEAHGRSRLTEAQVRDIRVMPAPYYVIAAVFGISWAQVRNIKTGRHWKHVT